MNLLKFAILHKQHGDNSSWVDYCQAYLDFANETITKEKDDVLIYSTINTLVFIFSMISNICGLWVDNYELYESSFSNYLKMSHILSIPLTTMSYLIMCSLLIDHSVGLISQLYVSTYCHFLQRIYRSLDNCQMASMFYLCVHVIRQQREPEKKMDKIGYLRWPLMLTLMSAGVFAIPVRGSNKSHYQHKTLCCKSTVLQPQLNYLAKDIRISLSGLYLDGFALLLLIVLLIEVYLKKRRWKKTVKAWDKKRSSLSISINELNMDTTRKKGSSGGGRQYRRERNPSIWSGKSSVASSTKRMTLNSVTIEKDFYQQEALPDSQFRNTTSITLGLMVSLVIFRLPRDVLTELEVFTDGEMHFSLATMLSGLLIHQVGLIVPVLICCFYCNEYTNNLMNRLFDLKYNERMGSHKTELNEVTAKELVGGLKHTLTEVHTLDEWIGDFECTRIRDHLAFTVTHFSRQDDILDILAKTSENEEPFMENFSDEGSEIKSSVEARPVSLLATSTTSSDEAKATVIFTVKHPSSDKASKISESQRSRTVSAIY